MSYLKKIASVILDWECTNPENQILLLAGAKELLVLAEAQTAIQTAKMIRISSPLSQNSTRVQEFVDELQRTERDINDILESIESIQSGTATIPTITPTSNEATQELAAIACVKLASLSETISSLGEKELSTKIEKFLEVALSA